MWKMETMGTWSLQDRYPILASSSSSLAPMFQPFSVVWHKSHDSPSPRNITELQIPQVQDIKISEQHFSNDIIKTPVWIHWGKGPLRLMKKICNTDYLQRTTFLFSVTQEFQTGLSNKSLKTDLKRDILRMNRIESKLPCQLFYIAKSKKYLWSLNFTRLFRCTSKHYFWEKKNGKLPKE